MSVVSAVLVDIEGTTTSIAFVYETLFRHARRALPHWVRAHASEPTVSALLEDVRAEVGDADLDLEGVIAQLDAWMQADRKVTPLKALQGHVWADGYESGAYTGHVYPDAVAALRRWSDAGLTLAVYSSGSVRAQELLFGWSDAGDLRPLFAAHFDTRVGHKREPDSYRHIATELARPPAEIVFLSDVPAELDAAREAGLRTLHVVRESDGTAPNTSGHAMAPDLSRIEFG